MKKMMIGLLGMLFCCSVFAARNHCSDSTFGSICYFDSLDYDSEKEIYFYCDTKFAPFVKMKNHGVLISGFHSGRGAGSGILSLIGTENPDILGRYYFTVKVDPNHDGEKYVNVQAAGKIKCRMGKGRRSAQYPGDFG